MSQSDEVREHFDRMGADGSYVRFYAPEHNAITHDFLARLARVKELLDDHVQSGRRVLDLGCGTGPIVEYVCSRGALYSGVDVAPRMLEAIATRVARSAYAASVALQIGSSEEIPHSPNSFDVVVAMGLVEYLDDPVRTLQEISRVTKPGGVALVTVPNLHSLHRFLQRHATVVTRLHHRWLRLRGATVVPTQPIVHHEFAPRILDRLFARHGLDRVGRAFYDHKLVFYPFTRLLPGFAFRVNSRIENRVPFFLANGYIGLYRKSADETVPESSHDQESSEPRQ
jgi:SAM-dependent methyltransferase